MDDWMEYDDCTLSSSSPENAAGMVTAQQAAQDLLLARWPSMELEISKQPRRSMDFTHSQPSTAQLVALDALLADWHPDTQASAHQAPASHQHDSGTADELQIQQAIAEVLAIAAQPIDWSALLTAQQQSGDHAPAQLPAQNPNAAVLAEQPTSQAVPGAAVERRTTVASVGMITHQQAADQALHLLPATSQAGLTQSNQLMGAKQQNILLYEAWCGGAAAARCANGPCAYDCSRPCKRHVCRCCKTYRQLQNPPGTPESRKNLCGMCKDGAIVDNVMFVRCLFDGCGRVMVHGAHKKHWEQHGNPTWAEPTYQELDPEHVPAGRRCTHCTNLRPVAYFNHVKAKCVTCQGIAAPVPTLPPASSVALPGAGHGEAHAVAEAGASHRLGAYQSLLSGGEASAAGPGLQAAAAAAAAGEADLLLEMTDDFAEDVNSIAISANIQQIQASLVNARDMLASVSALGLQQLTLDQAWHVRGLTSEVLRESEAVARRILPHTQAPQV